MTIAIAILGFLLPAGVLCAIPHLYKKLAPDGLQCGRCRYPLRRLRHSICPECGEDVGDLGIFAPRFRLALLVAGRVCAILILAASSALVLTSRDGLRPARVTWTWHVELGKPGSEAYASMVVSSTIRVWEFGSTTPQPPQSPSLITATLITHGGSAERLDFAADAISEQAVHDWFVQLGLDDDSTKLDAEAAVIADIVRSRFHTATVRDAIDAANTRARRLGQPPPFAQRRIGGGVTNQTSAPYVVVGIAILAALSGYGVLLSVRAHRHASTLL